MEAAKGYSCIELTGIMSTGSKQSKDCAEKYNVPIYTDCELVPDNVDLVAVAIKTQTQGGSGSMIAKSFLEKGIYRIYKKLNAGTRSYLYQY